MAKKILWKGSDEVVVKYALKDGHGVDIDIEAIQEQIDDIVGIGRFLSLWNCSTGTATTNPPSSPYTYNTGDYFIVKVSGNRIPHGTSYTIGGTNYETAEQTYAVGDVFYFDGTVWQNLHYGSGGNVIDVEVNGTSVVENGVAKIAVSLPRIETPSSTTLTNAQIEQVVKGCIMPDGFSSLTGNSVPVTFLPGYEFSGMPYSYYRGTLITGNSRIYAYEINKSTRVIRLISIASINVNTINANSSGWGIVVPAVDQDQASNNRTLALVEQIGFRIETTSPSSTTLGIVTYTLMQKACGKIFVNGYPALTGSSEPHIFYPPKHYYNSDLSAFIYEGLLVYGSNVCTYRINTSMQISILNQRDIYDSTRLYAHSTRFKDANDVSRSILTVNSIKEPYTSYQEMLDAFSHSLFVIHQTSAPFVFTGFLRRDVTREYVGTPPNGYYELVYYAVLNGSIVVNAHWGDEANYTFVDDTVKRYNEL